MRKQVRQQNIPFGVNTSIWWVCLFFFLIVKPTGFLLFFIHIRQLCPLVGPTKSSKVYNTIVLINCFLNECFQATHSLLPQVISSFMKQQSFSCFLLYNDAFHILDTPSQTLVWQCYSLSMLATSRAHAQLWSEPLYLNYHLSLCCSYFYNSSHDGSFFLKVLDCDPAYYISTYQNHFLFLSWRNLIEISSSSL